jgi:hypothetical protein
MSILSRLARVLRATRSPGDVHAPVPPAASHPSPASHSPAASRSGTAASRSGTAVPAAVVAMPPGPVTNPAAPRVTPPGPLPAPADGSPDPAISDTRVIRVDLPTLLAGLRPRGRPVLVVHWASWDTPSTDGLAAVQALLGRCGGAVAARGVAWDEFVEPPLPRIAPMAIRPARWSEGEQAAAWVRAKRLDWPTFVFAEVPERLFEGLGLVDRFVPQVTLYGLGGQVLAHHGGPLVGPEWARFAERVLQVAVGGTGVVG